MSKLQPVRGMKDLLPEDFQVADHIITSAREVASRYGYAPMSTPIVEHTGVFARTLGESSEVVSKEMYSFLDRSEDSLTLRPEFTAGIMRAFVSGGLQQNLPLKFFSAGPVFRYDRPQAGRHRQFHQINCEFLGADGPYTDAEVLRLAADMFEAWSLSDDVTLELNSLGDTESRKIYQVALFDYFSSHKNALSEDSLARLNKNPMRILDSKDEGDRKLVANAPLITQYYGEEAKKYFDDLLHLLEVMNVKYQISPRLVRGLDYYCHTAFEFTTTKLGAQSTVLAGGRYDGLCKLMGGSDVPAIGFAGGVERLALMKEFEIKAPRPYVIIPIGDENFEHSIMIASKLRSAGKMVLLEHKGKIGKRMQNADKARAQYVIFIGSEELANQAYKVKDMDSGNEKVSRLEDL
jgi:histidyl-tRNA synthetase